MSLFGPKRRLAQPPTPAKVSWRMFPSAPPSIRAVGYRRLDPGGIRLSVGRHGVIFCTVEGDAETYRGVFASRLFPVRYASNFIALFHIDTDEKPKEIGVVEDLALLRPGDRDHVNQSLAKNYNEQVIVRIYAVNECYDFLFFDVETARRGYLRFVLPWRHDRAEDYGENGKIILDAYDNRYIIPDVSELPQADRRAFTHYIYW